MRKYHVQFQEERERATFPPYSAIALQEMGLDEEALDAYDQAIRIDPEYTLAWKNKKDILFEIEGGIDFLEASQIVTILESDQALKINPEDFDTWMNKGEALDYLDRYEESIEAYDQALKINSEDIDAWMKKGDALYHLDRYEEGRAAYNQALDIYPGEETWESFFTILNSTERYEDLLTETEQAISIHPEFEKAWQYKGEALYNLGRSDDADESFEKAEIFSPKSISGIFSKFDQREEEKVAANDQELKNNPEDIDLLKKKGEALYSARRFDEAIEVYNQILKINTEDTDTWWKKGQALYSLDRFNEGRTAFDQALTINPKEEIWENFFFILKYREQYEDLLSETEQAISSNPDFADAWLYKGHALYNLDRYDEAIVAYDRAKSSPSIGLISGITNLPENDEMTKPVNATPVEGLSFSVQDWIDMGNVLFELGRYEKAIQAYEEALTIEPGNSRVKTLLDTAKGKRSN